MKIVTYQLLWPILGALACLFFLGCGRQPSVDAPQSANTAPAARRTVVDEIGRQVAIVPNPQRIVSLAPNITEILFALGLGRQVVGVTSYCDYPPEATEITKVGDTLRPNLERIISLRPDLVLISTASQLEQFSSSLEQAGIPVFVLKSQSVEGIFHSIETVGQIANREAEAKALVSRLRTRLAAITRRLASQPRPRVFFIVGTDPLITAGHNAFITDLINLAGGDSISADVPAEWPVYSVETVIARVPEIILLSGTQHGNEKGEMELPAGLRATPAVQEGRIYAINDELILRPGPRIIDGLEEMAKFFHPEVVP